MTVTHTTPDGHIWTLEEDFFAAFAPEGTPRQHYTRATSANGLIKMSVATPAEADAFDAFCARYFVAAGDIVDAEERGQATAARAAWRAAADFFLSR